MGIGIANGSVVKFLYELTESPIIQSRLRVSIEWLDITIDRGIGVCVMRVIRVIKIVRLFVWVVRVIKEKQGKAMRAGWLTCKVVFKLFRWKSRITKIEAIFKYV